jgi:hypothetical protein
MTDTWDHLIQIDVHKKDDYSVKEPELFFYMPDLLRNFNWNRGLNPHYKRAKAESDAWLESLRYEPLGAKPKVKAFKEWCNLKT